MFGDWGIGPVGWDTRVQLQERVRTRHVDAAIHMGDIGYDLNDVRGRVGDIWG